MEHGSLAFYWISILVQIFQVEPNQCGVLVADAEDDTTSTFFKDSVF